MMQIILYLYHKSNEIVALKIPVSKIVELKLFDKLVQMKYDIPNDRLDMFDEYYKDIDSALTSVRKKEAAVK